MYTPQNFDHLLGLKGFSEQLLQNHFKLYQGYVINTNKILEALATMEKDGKTATPEYAELKRRFGWEFNGMRLHELYFGNMTKKKTDLSQNSPLYKKMVETFGSGEKCHSVFVETGKMRGIGWVVMAYDPAGKKLFHLWINEHDVGHLAGTVPLLIMDVFEHAFMLDYGLNRADYIKAFIEAVDWEVVQRRYDEAQM
ncbi:MAG TPA: Fe-Mn family superoxide dismutase [Candidatus Nanoarchaeia archaeon]|nr:Fe-Mn family superoxide dismutase [Candidatus Nanoarchaeia archaeon]